MRNRLLLDVNGELIFVGRVERNLANFGVVNAILRSATVNDL